MNDINQTLRLAEAAGRIMLENGAETYRTEDTVIHICRAAGYSQAEVLVIPTGIFMTLCDQAGQRHTSMLRVSRRGINLNYIHEVNAIARQVGTLLPAQDALARLEALHDQNRSTPWSVTLAAGPCSGFFALVFGGGLLEFILATIAGTLAALAGRWAGRLDNNQVFSSLLGGLIIAAISLSGITLLGPGDLNATIAGAVLPMLPGLAMTVAIRDTMRGDLVSGVTRTAEALLSAACVAVGVGTMLGLWLKLGGALP